MLTLITACDRHDLLIRTIDSLVKDQVHRLAIAINEDSENVCIIPAIPNTMINTYKLGGIGQHESIEKFVRAASKNKTKYYLHIEEDWEFENSYDWIGESIKIMEANPTIIKVLCRKESPHPCKHDIVYKDPQYGDIYYGEIDPWESPDGNIWHGFSWNPGVTRLDLLNKFVPFPKWEQELAKNIYESGYKIVELKKSVYKHIGDGRSTHE